MTTIKINDTLSVEIHTGHDTHLAIDRRGGGLVAIQPGEVRHLVEALTQAAGLLARAAAQRVDRVTGSVLE